MSPGTHTRFPPPFLHPLPSKYIKWHVINTDLQVLLLLVLQALPLSQPCRAPLHAHPQRCLCNLSRRRQGRNGGHRAPAAVTCGHVRTSDARSDRACRLHTYTWMRAYMLTPECTDITYGGGIPTLRMSVVVYVYVMVMRVQDMYATKCL